jgi:hypothetical protein
VLLLLTVEKKYAFMTVVFKEKDRENFFFGEVKKNLAVKCFIRLQLLLLPA